MKKLAAILVVLGIALLALSSLQRKSTSSSANGTTRVKLTVYCAAGLKKPVEAIAKQYQAEEGVEVQLQFGGTGTLLSQIRVAKQGDLFIAADDKSLADARKFDAIHEVLPLVQQHPVIAVAAGNPKDIHTLDDLLREDVRVALANPEAASIGKVVKAVLAEKWEPISKHAVVMKPTVTEITADLSLGAVDASVVWNSTVPQFKGVEAVEVPELQAQKVNASAAVLVASKQPTAALKFARYLTAPEKGAKMFAQQGFIPAGGDKWAEKPEMILFSGGVNRPAIEKLLKQFAEREGADVTTVFNGCGVLCASMKSMLDARNPKFPDAYYACDLCFVPPVAEHFPDSVLITETDIGIIVQKGNPKNIKTLADLAQPGLKVGLCNAMQSTLGYMTKGMLKSAGLLDSVTKNVVVQVPTADFLVNQMRAGALDAAIVYRVNAAPQSGHIDYLTIDHAGAKAVQPFAVRGNSPNHRLAERLLAHLKANRAEFEEAGFIWRGDEAPIKSKDIQVPDWLKD
jgi:molybdate transport system substrate-binding protein